MTFRIQQRIDSVALGLLCSSFFRTYCQQLSGRTALRSIRSHSSFHNVFNLFTSLVSRYTLDSRGERARWRGVQSVWNKRAPPTVWWFFYTSCFRSPTSCFSLRADTDLSLSRYFYNVLGTVTPPSPSSMHRLRDLDGAGTRSLYIISLHKIFHYAFVALGSLSKLNKNIIPFIGEAAEYFPLKMHVSTTNIWIF